MEYLKNVLTWFALNYLNRSTYTKFLCSCPRFRISFTPMIDCRSSCNKRSANRKWDVSWEKYHRCLICRKLSVSWQLTGCSAGSGFDPLSVAEIALSWQSGGSFFVCFVLSHICHICEISTSLCSLCSGCLDSAYSTTFVISNFLAAFRMKVTNLFP